MSDELSEQAKAVFGLLTGKQYGPYIFYPGQRVRTRYEAGLYGDLVTEGTLRGFSMFHQLPPFAVLSVPPQSALIEIDNEPFMLGGQSGKYRNVWLSKIVPID